MRNAAIIATALLILTACQYLPKGTARTTDIHTGTQGIELTALPGIPPNTVYEEEPIPFAIDIWNKGATDVTTGIYALTIEDNAVQAFNDRVGNFELLGKSQTNPNGEKQRLSFDLKARELDPQTETYTTTLSLTTCYPYQTIANANVCVDSDIFNEEPKKPCRPGTTGLGSQGAPITITRVETKMLTHRDKNKITPEFTINLNNAQRGIVIAKNAVAEACSSEPLPPDSIGTVIVSATLADQQLTCLPQSDAKSKDAKVRIGAGTTIRCTLPEGIPKTRGTYTSILSIKADYGYTSTLSSQTRIQRRG